MDSQSLKFSQVASALAAGGCAIGFISMPTLVTGVAAAVTFGSALYFSLQKPRISG